MPAKRLFLFLFLLIGAIYLYKNVLPYHFSPQDPLTPEKISQSGIYDRAHEKGIWHGQEVSSYEIPQLLPQLAQVLGTTNDNKRIEVDLTNQRVYAFEGEKKVFDFLVSTGKWGPTPTGKFTIAYKTLVTRMTGGNVALGTFYDLPNVQFTMFFGNSEIPWGRGFSLHGAYWHNNFGHPMSHGCVNMRNEDAEKLFYWATPDMEGKRTITASNDNPGTPVIIYGTPPIT